MELEHLGPNLARRRARASRLAPRRGIDGIESTSHFVGAVLLFVNCISGIYSIQLRKAVSESSAPIHDSSAQNDPTISELGFKLQVALATVAPPSPAGTDMRIIMDSTRAFCEAVALLSLFAAGEPSSLFGESPLSDLSVPKLEDRNGR